MEELPFVSINMPVWERANFIYLITHNLKCIDYPKEKLELVILDDSTNAKLFRDIPQEEFEKAISPIKLNYIYDKNRKSIGEKRNILCKRSSHNIIINMDSDDLYFSTYVKYAVETLKKGNYGAVGSAEMLFLYPEKDWKITGIKCVANRQIHEATLCYTKKHFRAMGGFAKNSQGEGAKMFDFMNNSKIKQLNIGKCMVCVCHKDNTCDKEMFLDKQEFSGVIGEKEKQIIAYSLKMDYDTDFIFV